MSQNLTKKDKDEFQEILIEMDFLIGELLEIYSGFEKNYKHKLDFSPESLESLELFFIAFLNGKIKIDKTKKAMIVMIAYYFGEVVTKNIGGKWIQSEINDISFGDPIIIGYSKVPDTYQNPLLSAYNFSLEKKKGALQTAYKNALKWSRITNISQTIK